MPSGATRDCAYLEDKPSGRTEGQHKNQRLPVKEAKVFKAWAHTSSYMTLCSTRTWQVLKMKRLLQAIYRQALGSGLPGTVTNRPNYLPCMLKPAWSLSRNEQFGNVQPHDKFFHRPSLWVGVNQHTPALWQNGRREPLPVQERSPSSCSHSWGQRSFMIHSSSRFSRCQILPVYKTS